MIVESNVTRESYFQKMKYSESIEDLTLSKSTERESENAVTEIASNGNRNHTFVVLIDIVFTDNSKRTCTGTIIHDNVAITASHCFVNTYDKSIHPELTTSCVVVGTQKMFETGYEQYLPIERIISHHKFKGWRADIALVYTFAGMMSDKPGTVIPLAGKKTFMPKHCNVTVLSWGQCKKNKLHQRGYVDWRSYIGLPLRAGVSLFSSDEELTKKPSKILKNSGHLRKVRLNPKVKKLKRNKSKNIDEDRKQSTKARRVTKLIQRAELDEDTYDDSLNVEYQNEINKKLLQTQKLNYATNFENWRRNMGREKNELTVENFKFVNTETCRELIRNSLPHKYNIKNPNEYVCYTSEDHVVTDEDSGAPAVRQGHLVAVTLGSVESEGDYVTFGIKISCFCRWIADNLPDGEANLDCCDRCCDDDETPPPHEGSRQVTGMGHVKRKKKRNY